MLDQAGAVAESVDCLDAEEDVEEVRLPLRRVSHHASGEALPCAGVLDAELIAQATSFRYSMISADAAKPPSSMGE